MSVQGGGANDNSSEGTKSHRSMIDSLITGRATPRFLRGSLCLGVESVTFGCSFGRRT